MLPPRFLVSIFSVGMMVLGTGAVYSQDYPNKPIRMVTTGVGGDADILLRLVMPGISDRLGQSVIIENRPAGIIPAEIVSRATPDGYTLLTMGSPMWIGALLQKTPYDPVRDFSPITNMTKSPAVLVVHPSVAANSVKELIALAKAKPGVLNYASGGTGGTSHLAAELFNSLAGVNIVRVNYKSGSLRLGASLNGEVQVQFISPGTVASHVKAGKLKSLAVTSAEPSALAPGVPTIAASGLAGYEVVGLQGLFAPAKTPAAIIKRLNQEVVLYLNQPNVKQRILDSGEEVVGSSAAEFAAKVKAEMARMGKVIKDAGIKAD